mgnify:CR=1 FL=1
MAQKRRECVRFPWPSERRWLLAARTGGPAYARVRIVAVAEREVSYGATADLARVAEHAGLAWLDHMACTPRLERGSPVQGFAVAFGTMAERTR